MSRIFIDGKPMFISRADYCALVEQAESKGKSVEEVAAHHFAAPKPKRKTAAKKRAVKKSTK